MIKVLRLFFPNLDIHVKSGEVECVDPDAPMEECCVCGEMIYTCEREESVNNDYTCPAHPEGAQLWDGRWTCSPDCESILIDELDAEGHPDFDVGDIVKVKDEVWTWYLQHAGSWESPKILEMITHEPQPIERIDPVRGVKLTLPYWWFNFEDVEHVKH